MPRIPQAQRQVFINTVRSSNIGTAQAPFVAAAQAIDAVGRVAERQLEKQYTTQATKAESDFNLAAAEGFKGIQQDLNVQQNPNLARERTRELFNGFRNTPEYTNLPNAVQSAIGSRLDNLQAQYDGKALEYEIKQTFDNTARNINDTQSNFELQALTTDTPLDELLIKYTAGVSAATKDGIFTLNQAEQQIDAASRSITQNRAQRLLNSDDIAATRAFLSDAGVQENLGAKNLQLFNDKVDKRELVLLNEAEKRAQNERFTTAVQRALDLDAPLDPKNKETKKAIDAYYNNSGINAGLVSADNNAAIKLETLAARTNTIPTAAVSTLRGQLLNGNVQQQMFAVDTITRIQEASPAALDAFPQKDLSEAFLAQSYIRSGIAPGKAFELVKEQVDPLNKDVNQLRNAEINALSKSNDYASLAENALDPGIFAIGPDVPDAPFARDSVVADYRNIYEGFYKSVGDKDAAEQLANRSFKRFYGMSRVTGRRNVMKYPPENFYAVPGLDNEWMNEQLHNDVNKLVGKEVDMDDIVIIADSITAREAVPNGAPSYQVLQRTELGDFEELRDANGNLLRYRFDSTKARATYRLKVEKDLDKARKRREVRLKGEDELKEEDIFKQRFSF